MSRIGIIYIAFGEKSLTEATISVKSLKQNSPGLSSTLFTDSVVFSDYLRLFDDVVIIKNKHEIEYFFVETDRMIAIKTNVLGQINFPYEFNLYLDADTYIKGDISPIFDYLSCSDIVLTNDSRVEFSSSEFSGERPKPEKLIQLTNPSIYNSGVIAFKANITRQFFQTWWRKFAEASVGERRYMGNWSWAGGFNDQTILNQMIKNKHDLKTLDITIGVMPNTLYNATGRMWKEMQRQGLWQNARILHSHYISQWLDIVGENGLPLIPPLEHL
ncbi:hypothetical protein [Microcoleus sp. herbarium14]|uniref:hypothetical protein n=1 Tax=Microcoleus sp. herbarium14 TaxID=3055439 RepID=UPI002FD1F989